MTIALISVIIIAVVTCLSITFSKDKEINSLHKQIRELQDELNRQKQENKDNLN